MPKYEVSGLRFTDSGFVVYATMRWKSGVVRFVELRVPWEHFDDSDAWALYSKNARTRAEEAWHPDEGPSLPLDWS